MIPALLSETFSPSAYPANRKPGARSSLLVNSTVTPNVFSFQLFIFLFTAHSSLFTVSASGQWVINIIPNIFDQALHKRF
jgi:hypothetical protein